MTEKRIICPERLRRVPRQFSWVDHRLVRDGHITGLSHEARSLYLFLVTVSDAEGLSYYSDEKTCVLLGMESTELSQVRRELKETGLIAYQRPLYQVLSLDRPHALGALPPEKRLSAETGEAVSIREVLSQIAGGEK